MDTLYHYCNTSAFASIIGNREIWLSSLSLSNDTKEGKVVRDTFQLLLDQNKIYGPRASSVLEAVKALEEAVDGLGFCLSSDGDILSQWRGYSEDGHGFSIGFSIDYLKALIENPKKNEQSITLKKVVYLPEKQVEILKPIFDQIIMDVTQGKLDRPNRPGLLSGDLNKATEKYNLNMTNYHDALSVLVDKVFNAVPHLFSLKTKLLRKSQSGALSLTCLKIEIVIVISEPQVIDWFLTALSH